MNIYLAKLVFNIIIEGSNNTQFDEQTRIIEAKSMEEAFLKAKSIGKNEEDSFINANNQQVIWKFIDLSSLYPLYKLNDGEEVYSVTHEMEHPDTFIEFTRSKSMLIQTNFLTFA